MQHPPHFSSQITQTYNVYVNPYGMRRLSPMFVPGCFDVLCARGKLAYDHEGNRRFRALVKQHQKQYSAATCKYEKSKIVSFIVSAVRNASPQGGFVKNIDGSWYEVGDRHAKEKVGQTFRDLLHTKYSSSTKAKARARMQRRIKDQDAKEEEEEGNNKASSELKQQSKKKKETKATTTRKSPESVRSRTSATDEMRSSVSVVSDGSMEDHHDAGADSDATTVAKSNKSSELPPLTSVVVKTEPVPLNLTPMIQHPGRRYLPHVSPPQSQRTLGQSTNLLETLRGSLQSFDARVNASNLAGPNTTLLPAMPMIHDHSPEQGGGDLEPLPLGATAAGSVVNVDFNESNSSIQTEDSFEDLMSEYMSVAV